MLRWARVGIDVPLVLGWIRVAEGRAGVVLGYLPADREGTGPTVRVTVVLGSGAQGADDERGGRRIGDELGAGYAAELRGRVVLVGACDLTAVAGSDEPVGVDVRGGASDVLDAAVDGARRAAVVDAAVVEAAVVGAAVGAAVRVRVGRSVGEAVLDPHAE